MFLGYWGDVWKICQFKPVIRNFFQKRVGLECFDSKFWIFFLNFGQSPVPGTSKFVPFATLTHRTRTAPHRCVPPGARCLKFKWCGDNSLHFQQIAWESNTTTSLIQHSKNIMAALTNIKNETNHLIIQQRKLSGPCLTTRFKHVIETCETYVQWLTKCLYTNLVCWILQLLFTICINDDHERNVAKFCCCLFPAFTIASCCGIIYGISSDLNILYDKDITGIMPSC